MKRLNVLLLAGAALIAMASCTLPMATPAYSAPPGITLPAAPAILNDVAALPAARVWLPATKVFQISRYYGMESIADVSYLYKGINIQFKYFPGANVVRLTRSHAPS